MLCVKTRWMVIIGLIILLSLSGVASLQLRKDVTLKADDQVYQVSTYSSTVEEVLRQHNITLDPEDVVHPGLGTRLEDDMEIEVQRATLVQLYADGKISTIKTQPKTVGQLLAQEKITLGDMDKVEPNVDEYITSPTKVTLSRVSEEITEEIREIPFKTVSRGDNSLPLGEKKIIQAGEPGQEKVVTKKILEDGEVVSEEVEVEVIKAPKSQLVAKGTIQLASRGADNFEYTKAYTMEATAYSYNAGSKTALGTNVRVGAVAVDPKVIPLRSRLYIDGYGFAVAEDTGGAIKGMKIDLFMNTTEEAFRFGRRPVKVYLLK